MFIAVLFIIAPNWNRSKAHEQEKGQIQFGVPVSAILLGSRTLCRAALTTPPPPKNEGLISPSAGAAPGRQALAVSPFGGGVAADLSWLKQIALPKVPSSSWRSSPHPMPD